MWYFPFHYDPSYVFLNLIFTTKNRFVFLQIRKSKLSVTRVTQTISEELGIQHVSSDFIIYYHFWRGPCHTACEILVPWPGIKPMTQHWKHGVLSTGPPEASLCLLTLNPMCLSQCIKQKRVFSFAESISHMPSLHFYFFKTELRLRSGWPIPWQCWRAHRWQEGMLHWVRGWGSKSSRLEVKSHTWKEESGHPSLLRPRRESTVSFSTKKPWNFRRHHAGDGTKPCKANTQEKDQASSISEVPCVPGKGLGKLLTCFDLHNSLTREVSWGLVQKS